MVNNSKFYLIIGNGRGNSYNYKTKKLNLKEISSMVEQPFYTRKVGCSNHLFLRRKFFNLTGKVHF